MRIACYVCGTEQERALGMSGRCAVCGEPEGLLTAVEMLSEPGHTCIHCGEPGVVTVPIDNDQPGDSGVAIDAWSCLDCVHKRVQWENG